MPGTSDRSIDIYAALPALKGGDNFPDKDWRVIYRIDSDALVILDVFEKQTRRTPPQVIDACKRRLKLYEGSRP